MQRRQGDERLVIPGLEYGAWVQRGDPILGEYAGLDTFLRAPSVDSIV